MNIHDFISLDIENHVHFFFFVYIFEKNITFEQIYFMIDG